MKNLMKKLQNRKGFTLAELLIVVAIIGVLVAIAIPIFTTQLEKAREATDCANLRDAKAAAVAMYLDDTVTAAGTYKFDAQKGVLVKSTDANYDSVNGYGKGTAKLGNTETNLFCLTTGGASTASYYQNSDAVEGKVIQVVITNNTSADSITLSWINAAAAQQP